MAEHRHHRATMISQLNPPPHPSSLPPPTPPHMISNIRKTQKLTTTSSSSSGRRPTSGKHPIYRGIRSRSGKWVSEIREPLKTTRIWLGTHPTPEMAAAAYDVAALALKGSETAVNFPEYVSYYPVPLSPSAPDIQRAAASAAALMKLESGAEAAFGQPTNDDSVNELTGNNGHDFVDEEALFEMPNLLMEMAKGMLVSPPRMTSPPPLSDTPGNSDAESLWSY
ncbi:ethylene-responsive transcription factor ERF027-like [Olea europaea subsp. europaea]|uniref:Ethylene-responsive transcription factor ERF027-like n=1 Tax=Olea europaea subsp. europaea TaxID=158383 RepID=A0A8S0TJJ3_OLEEU|nr:ethylene-responsive transcription factor ERF027-like [Olea europaea subsp. europaea]